MGFYIYYPYIQKFVNSNIGERCPHTPTTLYRSVQLYHEAHHLLLPVTDKKNYYNAMILMYQKIS